MKIRIKNPIWGVPITFLDKYCPTQFEIIDINPHFFSMVEQGLPKPKQLTLHNAGKKDPYARILIKKVSLNKAFFRALKVKDDRLYLKLL